MWTDSGMFRDALLSGFLPEEKGPYALTPNTVKLIPTIGALLPRGGPVQDPVLTLMLPYGPAVGAFGPTRRVQGYLAHKKTHPHRTLQLAYA